MSCTNCNDNNSIPNPVNQASPCNPCSSPCTSCGDCDCNCEEPEYMTDGCYFTQNTDCTTYNGSDLSCPGVETGDTLTSVLQSLATYTKNTFTRLTSDSLVITATDDTCDDKAVIELVPSTDADNILVLGTDGLPYVPAPGDPGVSPTLVATDSSSIDFTTSGTLGHNLTASVKISTSSNNALVVNGTGLYVNGAAFEVPLTFNNGITRTSNTVQLGGTLIKDTVISLAGFDFNINGTDAFNFWSEDTNKFYKEDATYATVNVHSDTYWNAQVSLEADYNGSLGYFTKGYSDITTDYGLLAFGYPTTNTGNPAPSLDPKVSTYVKAKSAVLESYANKFTFTSPTNTQNSGALISGRRYQITAAGGTFTSSGASSNAVGTVFTANTTVPTWSTGAVKLIGEIVDSTVGYRGSVVNTQDDYSNSLLIRDTTDDVLNIDFKRCDLSVNVITAYSDWANTSYYAWGELTINSDRTASGSYTKVGHYTPTTNDNAVPAPSNDPAKTSYTTYTDGLLNSYAAQHTLEGAVLVKGLAASGSLSSSAIFQITSTTKGFLPPKMTQTQRNAISSPVAGLMVYQTDSTIGVYVYDGSTWRRLTWV